MGIYRYPGGKSRLLEPIKELLYPMIDKMGSFAEPFTGGGSVIIQVAKDYPDIELYANDLDVTIYSFWKMLENNNKSEIDEFFKMVNIKPTVEMFYGMRANGIPKDLVGRAFYGVFMNRCAFSGIQTAGAIGGTEQKSKWTVDCRYNAERIIKETRDLISLFNKRIHVSNLDCIDFIEKNKSSCLYLDPPYVVQGKSLYPIYMTDEQHVNLADALKNRKDWLLSIDICKEVDQMYSYAKLIPLDARYSIRDKKTKWTPKQEYLIISR